MNNRYIKLLPLICLVLYAITIMVFNSIMQTDPESARMFSMAHLVFGEIISWIASIAFAKFFFELYRSGKEIQVEDQSFLLVVIALLLLMGFKDTNIIIGAISRFWEAEISLPYLAALNGVGLYGFILIFLFTPFVIKKRKNKLNSSILPLLFLFALTSPFTIVSIIVIVILFLLLLTGLSIWINSLLNG